jgi:hypothetical protein
VSALSQRRRVAAIQSLECADCVGAFKAGAFKAATRRRSPKFGVRRLCRRFQSRRIQSGDSVAAVQSLDCADGVGAFTAATCRRNPKFGVRRLCRRFHSGDVSPQSKVWSAPTVSALSKPAHSKRRLRRRNPRRRLRRRSPKFGVRRRCRRFHSGDMSPQSKVWSAPTASALSKPALSKRRPVAAVQSLECADCVGAFIAATCRRVSVIFLRP